MGWQCTQQIHCQNSNVAIAYPHPFIALLRSKLNVITKFALTGISYSFLEIRSPFHELRSGNLLKEWIVTEYTDVLQVTALSWLYTSIAVQPVGSGCRMMYSPVLNNRLVALIDSQDIFLMLLSRIQVL